MLCNIQIFNSLPTSVFFKNCLFSEIKHKEQSHTSMYIYSYFQKSLLSG